jgi:DNA-binding transcriptional regulator PaaX
MYRIGKTQQKLLLTLFGGIALSMSTSPTQYYRTLSSLQKEWRRIGQYEIRRSAKRLAKQKLLEEEILPDGSFHLKLTPKGKREARRMHIFGSTIRFQNKKSWDKLWRIIVFDIPEKDRVFRDILRQHLYDLKFYKLQQSVFVSPHPYEKPLLQLVDLYKASKYVRIITAQNIDNASKLQHHFFSKK